MTSYVPPKKNAAYITCIALTDQSNTKLFKSNPTLAVGDVKISKDFGAFNNLNTLPDAEPDGSYAVRVLFTATEMNADTIAVVFHDASGDEWCDLMLVIQTATQQIDDLAATGADSDTLESLSDQMDGISNSAGNTTQINWRDVR